MIRMLEHTFSPFDDNVIVKKDVALDVAVDERNSKRYLNNYSALKKEDGILMAFNSFSCLFQCHRRMPRIMISISDNDSNFLETVLQSS
jgi:hypothetical protein